MRAGRIALVVRIGGGEAAALRGLRMGLRLRQLLQLAVVADSVEMEAFLAPHDAMDAADAPAPGGGGAAGGEGGGETVYQQT